MRFGCLGYGFRFSHVFLRLARFALSCPVRATPCGDSACASGAGSAGVLCCGAAAWALACGAAGVAGCSLAHSAAEAAGLPSCGSSGPGPGGPLVAWRWSLRHLTAWRFASPMTMRKGAPRRLFSEHFFRCDLVEALFFNWAEVCLVDAEARGATPIVVLRVCPLYASDAADE